MRLPDLICSEWPLPKAIDPNYSWVVTSGLDMINHKVLVGSLRKLVMAMQNSVGRDRYHKHFFGNKVIVAKAVVTQRPVGSQNA